jgi:hypothetical protein
MKEALVIFVRNPELGKVKTRLAATIGDVAALAVYKKLLEHTQRITSYCAADKYVFYAERIMDNDLWTADHYFKFHQHEGDLGIKMKEAFALVFSKGYQRAVIIGSDCPGLTEHHIQQAFSGLQRHDVVIGPARDGGYYLLGMNRLQPVLFEGKQWSTDTVYDDTIQSIEAAGLSYTALEMLTDVDEEKDLPESWRKDLSLII